VYDQSWGGVVDVDGIDDPGANFGMGYYNDHHFHFGYFVYAAAVIAKEEPDWLDTYGDAMMAIIRDFANPAPSSGADPHFTFMRNKDWYVGHSWAAGNCPTNMLVTCW
jgi:endo-1,3(4)-beta-glucanase